MSNNSTNNTSVSVSASASASAPPEEPEISLLVTCPHCQCYIFIEKLNCRIFRHGVFKLSGQQIPPHLDKVECDKLISEQRIYGCGKPFRINNELIAKICDYI